MAELIRDVELMTFNLSLANLSGAQYNIQIDDLEKEISRIMNSGSIGYVTYCQDDDMRKAFVRRQSAGFIQSYEVIRNLTDNVIWLYADIVLTMEALAFRKRFPDLSGFAMRCLAKEFNTDYGRIAQIESIQGFDFTFIEDGTKG